MWGSKGIREKERESERVRARDKEERGAREAGRVVERAAVNASALRVFFFWSASQRESRAVQQLREVGSACCAAKRRETKRTSAARRRTASVSVINVTRCQGPFLQSFLHSARPPFETTLRSGRNFSASSSRSSPARGSPSRAGLRRWWPRLRRSGNATTHFLCRNLGGLPPS